MGDVNRAWAQSTWSQPKTEETWSSLTGHGPLAEGSGDLQPDEIREFCASGFLAC